MSIESQLRDMALRSRVHERLRDGRLPVMVPSRINAGYGTGHVCVACDQQITSTQVEYELADCRDGTLLCFHLGCHVLWQIECNGNRSGKSDLNSTL